MCWIMVLGPNHELHSGDCASLAGTKPIAGELCGRQIAHLCTLAHAHHDPLAHASPAALVEAVRALVDAQDAVEHCR